ncbi:hypothetical protein CDAR_182421 [Caerostris darwini]|uniref:Uncharacterized protein n=1 Tax=Caerostris darwini TaxID=1538125 RepID=A0AAV4U5D5_9ARAC|nr:hypothetical protein CDAR_182421 [Caerostris darwini]
MNMQTSYRSGISVNGRRAPSVVVGAMCFYFSKLESMHCLNPEASVHFSLELFLFQSAAQTISSGNSFSDKTMRKQECIDAFPHSPHDVAGG